jgi:hypothetical protein
MIGTMRPRTAADAWVLLVVACGGVVFALAAVWAAPTPKLGFALLAAAAIVTEFMEVPQRGFALEGGEHSFTFSSCVFIGAVLLYGPWVGSIVAGGAIVAVGLVRRSKPRYVIYNAAVFTLAAAAGGLVFQLLGGTPGTLDLPGGFVAVAGAVAAVFSVNTLLVGVVVSLTTGTPLLSLQRDKFAFELPAVAGEAGLGLALAALAESHPWAIVALVPLVVGLYQAHARLALLHEETSRALEAFANLVDERDPSTFRHSVRVAELIGRLATSLALPASEVNRLRWAGRLHDLGKIAVDSSALMRPNDLSSGEWELMRRHPRLSARLLRRFRLAVPEARAIEYHHERFDGNGYYGIARDDVPLAAHFLIVADSYDAMISDRPYRRGLPRDRALAEIERAAGEQFHPVVAKAFVALQRGFDPLKVLTLEERTMLRGTNMPSGRRGKQLRRIVRRPIVLPVTALVVAVCAAGLGHYAVAGGALFVFAAAQVCQVWAGRSAVRLGEQLKAAAFAEAPLDAVLVRVGALVPVQWAGVLAWDERGLEGKIVQQSGDRELAPTETAVTSWIVRDAESDDEVLVTEGALGRAPHVALPLRSGDAVAAYLILRLAHSVPSRLEAALVAAAPALAGTLVPPAAEDEHQATLAVVG